MDKFANKLNSTLKHRHGHDAVVFFLTDITRIGTISLESFNSALTSKLVASQCRKWRTDKLLPVPIPLSRVSNATRQTSKSLRALVLVLEEWQFMTRLWGALDTWMAFKEVVRETLESNNCSFPDRLDQMATILQNLSLGMYQALEAIWWLSIRGVLKWSEEAQDKIMAWSSRLFVIFAVFEVGRLLVRLRNLRRNSSEDYKARWEEWKTEFYSGIAWTLFSAYYSHPEGLFPEPLFSVVSAYCSYGLIKQF